MSERRGDWQQTFTGRQFWPLDPRPDDIDVRDIAHALALQCRFAGHCRVPYSVAEHSVRVSDLIMEQTGDSNAGLAGLLHDAAEAYCVDVPRPLKPFLTGYKSIERRIAWAIEQWSGLHEGAFEEGLVKRADEVLLATEARDLMVTAPVPWTFAHPVEPLAEVIVPWSWSVAEVVFLSRFMALAAYRSA